MLPRHVIYYGVDQPLPEKTILHAGPLSLIYENGDLRYLRLGAREIIRRIYVAVRDHNWGTAPATIANLRLADGGDHFTIDYDVENRLGDIDFRWHGSITGDAQGTITFAMDGQAFSTFRRNRIGFCVLHPLDCAGAACRIEHVDGTVQDSQFPLLVAPQIYLNGRPTPHGDFHSMRALTHQVTPDLWAELRFEGDEFETEDQRNWTDASYKTYCTPLQRPFPVEVSQGTRITQSLRLTLKGRLPAADQTVESEVVQVTFLDKAARPLLPIGLGMASHGQPLTPNEIERLRTLRLSHLRVDLKLSSPGWQAMLARATADSRALSLPLEVALTVSDAAESELNALLEVLQTDRPTVAAWLVFYTAAFSTPERWLVLARNLLARYAPTAEFGSGTDANLAELNRARPPAHLLDFVSFAANPQVHAFDNATLVENCAALAQALETVHAFSGKPVTISPITLKQRFNPVATGPEPEPQPGQLPPQVDPRQMSLFGAGWTLGTLKYLAENPAARSVTYYETTGWRGVMETQAGSPLPQKFPSLPGSVYPMYHVFADVAEFVSDDVIPVESSGPLRVEALALRQQNRTRLLLANLDAEPQTVSVPDLGGQARLWLLDETSAEDAMRAPEAFRARPGTVVTGTGGAIAISLPPFAIARLDFTVELG